MDAKERGKAGPGGERREEENGEWEWKVGGEGGEDGRRGWTVDSGQWTVDRQWTIFGGTASEKGRTD